MRTDYNTNNNGLDNENRDDTNKWATGFAFFPVWRFADVRKREAAKHACSLQRKAENEAEQTDFLI